MEHPFIKRLCLLMSFFLILSLFPSATAAAIPVQATGTRDYTIDSPYKDVNWNTWHTLKAALHTHTIASDGASDLNESVEKHYELGFDILAVTDHMIVHRRWDTVPQTVPIMNLMKRERNQGRKVTPVTPERYQDILDGVGRDGRGMLDVPMGIELNGAVPSNSHVNGLFADYGQGLIGIDGDYETPVREVEKRGGITFLNHVGTFTKAYAKDDPSISKKPIIVNKFARIFLDYPSCVAMDINSGTDTNTRYDRILWDEVLQKTIPHGRNVSAISFSDGHGLEQFDRAFSLMMMPENTVEALRTCMETGAFFPVATYACYELGNDFRGEGPTPAVTRVTVDQQENRITLEGIHYDAVTWVADGNIIATGNTIDLNDYEDDLGCYVRAYLTGSGGICYTQAFVLSAPDVVIQPQRIPRTLDYSVFLRTLTNFLETAFLQRSVVFGLLRFVLLGV